MYKIVLFSLSIFFPFITYSMEQKCITSVNPFSFFPSELMISILEYTVEPTVESREKLQSYGFVNKQWRHTVLEIFNKIKTSIPFNKELILKSCAHNRYPERGFSPIADTIIDNNEECQKAFETYGKNSQTLFLTNNKKHMHPLEFIKQVKAENHFVPNFGYIQILANYELTQELKIVFDQYTGDINNDIINAFGHFLAEPSKKTITAPFLELLLQQFPHLAIMHYNKGYTGVHAAVIHKNKQAVALLLEYNANVNSKDKMGNIALDYALQEKLYQPGIVQLLVPKTNLLSFFGLENPLPRNHNDIYFAYAKKGLTIRHTALINYLIGETIRQYEALYGNLT